MSIQTGTSFNRGNKDLPLSLYHLLDPEVLANPYPLYHRLRTEDPVHWDPYLHTWIVTRYADVITVLQHFSASRTPTPEQLTALGLSQLVPFAQVLVRRCSFWIRQHTVEYDLWPQMPSRPVAWSPYDLTSRISRTASWMLYSTRGAWT